MEGSFGLKLKEDFLYVFMDNYNHNGFTGEQLQLANDGKLRLDQNTEALVDYYQFLERKTFNFDTETVYENDEKLEQFFMGQSIEAVNLSHHLLNKMLVFSCPDPEIRQQFIHCFNHIIDNGEKWLYADDLNETIDQDFNDANRI